MSLGTKAAKSCFVDKGLDICGATEEVEGERAVIDPAINALDENIDEDLTGHQRGAIRTKCILKVISPRGPGRIGAS
jgi:hypothetical protein